MPKKGADLSNLENLIQDTSKGVQTQADTATQTQESTPTHTPTHIGTSEPSVVTKKRLQIFIDPPILKGLKTLKAKRRKAGQWASIASLLREAAADLLKREGIE